MANPNVTVHGGLPGLPTLLGQGPARIPTGGKIRAGIKVLTRKAAEQPQAQRLYDEGVEAGQSFELHGDHRARDAEIWSASYCVFESDFQSRGLLN